MRHDPQHLEPDDANAATIPAPDDALREWIVSKRMNKAGVGDDDPTPIEPTKNA